MGYGTRFHFDYFLPAFLTLFEVATLEGWVDVMYRANDVAERARAHSSYSR